MALTHFTGLASGAGDTITVRKHNTLDLGVLYEDGDGATPLGNPLTSDLLTGAYSFWADDAFTYDIDDTTDGIPVAQTPPVLVLLVSGTSPNRTLTLMALDQGNQIALAQVTY